MNPSRLAAHRDRIADVVIALACGLGTLFTGEGQYAYLAPPAGWLLAVMAVGVAACALPRRGRPLVFLAGAWLVWIVAAAYVPLLAALYTLGERAGWRVATAGTAASLVLVGIPIWPVAGMDAATPISLAYCVVPAFAGGLVRIRRDLVAARRERAERFQRERVARARGDERARIARDMHDVVAHRVSLMVMHATALQQTTTDSGSGRLAATVGELGREALNELRTLVDVLRADDAVPLSPRPGLADVDELLDESRQLGVPVGYEFDAEPGVTLSPLVGHTVYRVVQEALTNVRKHAGSPATEVAIRVRTTSVTVIVRNAAGRVDAPAQLPGGGHGLLGVRERVELVGGELNTGSTRDGGFSVTVRLPLDAGRSS